MARSRKPYNKGYKVMAMDSAKPFSKVGENPSKMEKTATAMRKSQYVCSPQGSAKLKPSKLPI